MDGVTHTALGVGNALRAVDLRLRDASLSVGDGARLVGHSTLRRLDALCGSLDGLVTVYAGRPLIGGRLL